MEGWGGGIPREQGDRGIRCWDLMPGLIEALPLRAEKQMKINVPRAALGEQ